MIIKLLEEYGYWGLVFSFVIPTVIVMFSDRVSGAFQAWLGTDKEGVIGYLGVAINGVIASYKLFKSKESTKRIIKLSKKYWHWGFVFSLVILTVIVMFPGWASGAFQVWLGTDTKGVIGYLGTIIGATALYGLFKSKESTKRIIKLLKEYWSWVKGYWPWVKKCWPWRLVFFLIILIDIVMFSDRASDTLQSWFGADEKEVIEYLGWVIGAIVLYELFKFTENTKRIIEPLKAYGFWGLILSLVILIAIVMFSDRASDTLQAWLGADKKGVIEYLGKVIGGVIVLYGLFKFKESRKRIIKLIKGYGPWVLVIFIVTLIVNVMFSDPASWVFQVWFGTTQKETIEFFGWAIGGVIALYGFLKLEERARAQSDANDLERFKTATEHLSEKGLDKKSIMRRIASFYEFYYLARNNKDYCEIASNILIACLELMPKNERSKEKQHLLNVLFGKGKNLWKLSAKDIDLQEVCLEKMNLANFDLQDADLRGANLQGANLQDANLRNANLRGANLRGAKLQRAKLQYAKLQDLDLQNMDLQGIDLQGADLQGAILIRSILTHGNLKSAVLVDAEFFRANLRDAFLTGADVDGADFRRANLMGADMVGMRNYSNASFQNAKYNVNTKEPTKAMHLSSLGMIMVVNEE